MTHVVTVNGKPVMVGDTPVTDENKNLLLPQIRGTSTGVVDVPYKDVTPPLANEAKKEDKKSILFIQTPVFMLFAEFIGYTSMLINIAEDWCNPSKAMPSKAIQRMLDREARTIYDEMLELYTEEEIHDLYNRFYPCGLDEIEDDLNDKINDFEGGLPF